MNRVHIANTDFEFELAHSSNASLENRLKGQPLSLQLQFLPLLYGEEDDIVAVTQMPDESFLEELQALSWRKGKKLPQLALLSEKAPFESSECFSWGYSRAVQIWTKQRRMHYDMPDWEVVREVNSKAFSHSFTTLSEVKLIWNLSELKAWRRSFSGKKVLKSCFGLSGKGMKICEEVTPIEELHKFCEKEWKEKRGVVAEPWLERIFDFSTQWEIGHEGTRLIGSTVFKTTPRGTYNATIAGPEKDTFKQWISFLEEHKTACKKALQKMAEKGFFGHVGIDALLYQKEGHTRLYPIVEINARKTMSWVALHLQQKYFPDRSIQFEFVHYTTKDKSLLPLSLPGIKPFSHALTISPLVA